MNNGVVRRIVGGGITIWAASAVTFLLINVLPGSPAEVILGTQATPRTVRLLTQKLGLDKPLWVQYVHWMGGLLSGNLGHSYISGQAIGGELSGALQVSIPLVVLSMLMGLGIAVPLGLVGAIRGGRAFGPFVSSISQAGIAVPNFVLGIMLIIVVAVDLHILPASGFPGWADPLGSIRALILPAISLSMLSGAVVGRYLRAGIADVLSSDHFKMARAKGMTRRQALSRHGLRNAALPVVTVLGMQFAGLIVGAVVVENVFTLPGVGTLLLNAIENRDLLVVQDVVMLIVTLVVMVNVLVDIAYRWIDPRVGSPA